MNESYTVEPFPLPPHEPTPLLSPADFARQMRLIYPLAGHPNDGGDDAAHKLGDALLCDLLRSLGYGDGVDVFERAAKWYA